MQNINIDSLNNFFTFNHNNHKYTIQELKNKEDLYPTLLYKNNITKMSESITIKPNQNILFTTN